MGEDPQEGQPAADGPVEEGAGCSIIPEGDPSLEIAPDGSLILHNPTPEMLEVALTLNPNDEGLKRELELARRRFEAQARAEEE